MSIEGNLARVEEVEGTAQDEVIPSTVQPPDTSVLFDIEWVKKHFHATGIADRSLQALLDAKANEER